MSGNAVLIAPAVSSSFQSSRRISRRRGDAIAEMSAGSRVTQTVYIKLKCCQHPPDLPAPPALPTPPAPVWGVDHSGSRNVQRWVVHSRKNVAERAERAERAETGEHV